VADTARIYQLMEHAADQLGKAADQADVHLWNLAQHQAHQGEYEDLAKTNKLRAQLAATHALAASVLRLVAAFMTDTDQPAEEEHRD
jgi:hypothetical protein